MAILEHVYIYNNISVYIYVSAVNYIFKHVLRNKNFAFLLIPSFAVKFAIKALAKSILKSMHTD